MIYIKEAHPKDGRRRKKKKPDKISQKYLQPTTYDERCSIAGDCIEDLGINNPFLVDGIKNTVMEDYCALPDRLFIIGKDGKIAFRGDMGPKGLDPDDLSDALKKMFKEK